MIKLANRVKNFFHKHFVKHEVHWIPSTTIICLSSDGRKILQIKYKDIKRYARAKDGQDPKYLNCPDSWLQKCIYSDYEVKEEKPKGPQQPEEEPGIDMWNGEDEPKNGETV